MRCTHALIAAILVAFVATNSTAQGAWPPPEVADAPRGWLVERLIHEVQRIAAADPDPVRRAWAWRALGRVEDVGCSERMELGLADPSSAVRAEAVYAGRAGLSPDNGRRVDTRRRIAAAFESPDPDVRWAAKRVVELDEFEDEEGFGWDTVSLAAGLLDDSAAVREVCRERMEENDARLEEVAAARRRLALVGSPAAKVAMIESLEDGERDDPLWQEILGLGMFDDSPEVRLAATLVASPNRLEACTRLLADPDVIVRRRVFASHLLGRAEVPVHLIQAWLCDPDPIVADGAAAHAWEYRLPIGVDASRALRQVADPSDPRADAAAGLLFRAIVEAELDGRRFELPPGDAAFDDFWRAAEQLGALWGQLKAATGKPAAGAAEVGDDLAVIARLVRRLTDADPRVRRAACSVVGEAACWFSRQSSTTKGEEIRNVWESVFERLTDTEPSVRRAAVRQVVQAAERTTYVGRLRQLEQWMLKAIEDSDRTVAVAAATYFANTRWREAGPILKTALPEYERDSLGWNIRFQQLLSKSPRLFSDDELVALGTAPASPANEYSRRALFDVLLKRRAVAGAAAVMDASPAELAEKLLESLASHLPKEDLDQRPPTARACDQILAAIKPERAYLVHLAAQAYWLNDLSSQRVVLGWINDPAAPLGLRYAGLEVLEVVGEWQGDEPECDAPLRRALECNDAVAVLQAYVTLEMLEGGGFDLESEEPSPVLQQLIESARSSRFRDYDDPDSV